MTTDNARKIVALLRQASGYAAMARKGALTDDEAAELIVECNQQIAALRAQRDLPLSGAEAKPKGGRTS